jgi:hypothetical protein
VTVPTIRVDSMTVGDLTLSPATLPIVTDAMGGAQGVLATDEFTDQRVSPSISSTIASISGIRAMSGRATIS